MYGPEINAVGGKRDEKDNDNNDRKQKRRTSFRGSSQWQEIRRTDPGKDDTQISCASVKCAVRIRNLRARLHDAGRGNYAAGAREISVAQQKKKSKRQLVSDLIKHIILRRAQNPETKIK